MNRRRVYNPVLGRFHNPDPVIAGAGLSQAYNRYSYVLNNPLKYTDPSGYRPKGKKNDPDEPTFGIVPYTEGDRGNGSNFATSWDYTNRSGPFLGFNRSVFWSGIGINTNPGPGFDDLYVQDVHGNYIRRSEAVDIGNGQYIPKDYILVTFRGKEAQEVYKAYKSIYYYFLAIKLAALGEYKTGLGYGMSFGGPDDPLFKVDLSLSFGMSFEKTFRIMGVGNNFNFSPIKVDWISFSWDTENGLLIEPYPGIYGEASGNLGIVQYGGNIDYYQWQNNGFKNAYNLYGQLLTFRVGTDGKMRTIIWDFGWSNMVGFQSSASFDTRKLFNIFISEQQDWIRNTGCRSPRGR